MGRCRVEAHLFVVMPVVERTYYWRHPEQLLLACLSSDEAEVRSSAVDRTLAIRRSPEQINDHSQKQKLAPEKIKKAGGKTSPAAKIKLPSDAFCKYDRLGGIAAYG